MPHGGHGAAQEAYVQCLQASPTRLNLADGPFTRAPILTTQALDGKHLMLCGIHVDNSYAGVADCAQH